MTARSQRALRAAALLAVRCYQVAWRPLNLWGCKFYPSCSNFALEAIERHGAWRGTGLALRRLLRCRPGVLGGYDPVPEVEPPEPQGQFPGNHGNQLKQKNFRASTVWNKGGQAVG